MRPLAFAAAAFLCACSDKADLRHRIAGADPAKGLAAMQRTGCAACHVIPGIAWPRGTVGGSLENLGERSLIAGRFPNQPQILVRWIRDAPSLAPTTAMPAMPVTEAEARDIAAYLYERDDR